MEIADFQELLARADESVVPLLTSALRTALQAKKSAQVLNFVLMILRGADQRITG
jgi:hypothetical protein